ncbi:MAG: hypothetical protein H6733_06490 [Alphaproteobacteria bacterium]|nr:hypothetical protein [Alphaproteobacteria bacterium]
MKLDDLDLHCPDCGSANVVIFQQPASKFSTTGAMPGLRCRDCGSRAVGSRFPWPGTYVEPRPVVRRPEPVKPPAAVAPKPAPAVSSPVAAAAPRPVSPAPKAPMAPPPAPAARVEAPKAEPVKESTSYSAAPRSSMVETNACAWKDCDKAARKGSKYCSRDCSNKNARHRHAKRAEAERSAA